MKSKRLFSVIGNIDDSFISEDAQGPAADSPSPIYQKRARLRFTGLAACAAVLLLCVWAVPGLFNTSQDNSIIRVPFDPGNTSIAGLPVDNFNLADLHNPGGAEADRIVFQSLRDFYYSNNPCFAFVRVIETELWTEKYRDWSAEIQTSTLHILSALSGDDKPPETIRVRQSKFGGCCADEETNLLRAGGVYLLPLSHWDGDDTWYIHGDLDVLFEVDDQSRIWSHSQFEGFSRFNGKDASVLADSIAALTSDENFSSAITTFGRIAREWGALVEATVVTVTQTNDQWGYELVEYYIRADNVLSVAANPWYTWAAASGDEMSVISNGNIEHFKPGERYLLLLDPSEGGPYTSPERAAIIGEGGTIAPLATSEWTSVFAEFDGYTVAQMGEEALRAIAWHERYAD